MGYYSRGGSSFLQNLPKGIKTLLFINVVVYVLQMFFNLSRSHVFIDLFAINLLSIKNLAVWQFVTYMFLHGSFWHLFFNMFVLMVFGREIEEYWGTRIFTRYYLICGIGAGFFIFLIDSLRAGSGHPIGYTLGASGAIFGLMLAYALFYPNRELIIFPIPFPIKTKYMILGYAAYSLIPLIFPNAYAQGISHAGHLGGLISGVIYFRLKKKDYNYRSGNNTLDDFFDKCRQILGLRSRAGFVKEQKKTGFTSDLFSGIKFKKNNTLNLNIDELTDSKIEDTIDILLEKISQKGLKSLSMEEQLFLDKAARLFRHKFPS